MTPTNIICWSCLCQGTFRRPSDVVREHQLTNGLHPSAPPSTSRGDQSMVNISWFQNIHIFMTQFRLSILYYIPKYYK
jgi:hypothetical protein